MSKKRILATSIAMLLSTGLIAVGAGSAFAGDEGAGAGAQAGQEAAKSEMERVKVSEDTMLSMRYVNNARLALFNGQLETARTDIDAALTRIDVAVNEAEQYAMDVKAPKQDDWHVPFDTRIAMLDVYERDDAKADAPSGKTAHHGSQGKKDQGDETLKLDEVDLAVSTGLVPVKFAKQQIVDASSLLEKGDYFKANLALKAIDDAILIQTIAADDVEHNDAS